MAKWFHTEPSHRNAEVDEQGGLVTLMLGHWAVCTKNCRMLEDGGLVIENGKPESVLPRKDLVLPLSAHPASQNVMLSSEPNA
jgi:hypothetical protein